MMYGDGVLSTMRCNGTKELIRDLGGPESTAFQKLKEILGTEKADLGPSDRLHDISRRFHPLHTTALVCDVCVAARFVL